MAISKAAFVVVAVIVVGLAQLELYSAIRRAHYHPAVPLGLAFGALTMVAGYLKGEAAMMAMVALAVPFTFLWYMALPPQLRKGVLINAAMTLLPLLYVPFLAGFLLLILSESTALSVVPVAGPWTPKNGMVTRCGVSTHRAPLPDPVRT